MDVPPGLHEEAGIGTTPRRHYRSQTAMIRSPLPLRSRFSRGKGRGAFASHSERASG